MVHGVKAHGAMAAKPRGRRRAPGAFALLVLIACCAPAFMVVPCQRAADAPARRRMLLGIVAAQAPALSAEAKRPEGVNRPDLLPASDGATTPVIDVARILTSSQERELGKYIAEIETAAKVRLRVLTQTFPNTPGLAIKDYWKPDGRTVIYVHDTGGLGEGNVVNFNAGTEVEKMKPLTYWRQVQNTYGNRFYIRDHGDGDTVVDVVKALKEGLIPEEARN
mmetsp:Transcript_9819/g.23610  ORF Transcript_9819/g.23610 Transcript_9819/m.23610 type:complete len:222 (+) Transcript_9819:3-668(+)